MANSEFIEIISLNAKQQIDDIMLHIDKLAKKITDIPKFQLSNTPSGADNAIKQLTYDLAKQAKEIDNLKTKLAGLNQEKAKSNAITTQQKVDNAIILKQEKQQATLTSAYADAYAKLNAQRTIAKTKLQDLIASERASNKEIRQAQKEFDILNKKVAAADKAVGRFSDANRKINGLASSVGNLMTAFGIGTGIYLAIDIAKNIYETTKALQSLDLALKMVSGTTEEFASNQAFVTATAEKWGVEIKTLTEQYTYFYTAAKGLMSTAEIKTTFEGIAKAGAVMGLSLEKQSAAFYAFEQMMSKGIVTSEELKKQLGNSMPGAIRAAAMAYQELHPKIKTIQEAEMMLLKEMKRGAIDSATYVPLIVKNLEKLYGIEMVDKVETLQAAQNRLKNSWTELVRTMTTDNEGAFARTMRGSIILFNDLTNSINKAISSINKFRKTSGEEGKEIGKGDFRSEFESESSGLTKEGKIALAIKKGNDFTGNIKKSLYDVNLARIKYNVSQTKQTEEELMLAERKLGYYRGMKSEAQNIVNELSKIEPKKASATGTEGIDKNKKAKRDSIESVGTPIASRVEDTALERLKLLKAALEKTRDETSKTASEFKKWDKILEGVNGAIDQFTKPLTTDILPELTEKVKRMNDEAERAEQIAKNLEDAIKDTFNMFAGDFADRMGFTDTFDFMLGEDKNGNTLFDRLKTDEDHWKDYAIAVTTIAQDMYNFLNQQSQMRFEAEYVRLEEQKNVALKFAGDSTSAKEKIEEDYERKRKEIVNRENKAKKEQAMFNIAIDTAQAIMSAAPKVPLMIAMGVMGAIQLAMVAAKKVPQYWRGTDNAEAGLAWTNERGAELVTDKQGHIKDFGTNKGAKLTMMEKGDKVYTAQQTKKMMFDNDLNSIMMDNGIGNAPKIVVNSGMNKAEMKEALMETLGAMPMQSTIIDKNGLQHIITNGHSKTVFLTNRVSGVGLKV